MPVSCLKLDRVAKSFAGVAALKPLTLELQPGEILGLVGENGAGKSTLIKILSGVHLPDSGRIEWLGREVHLRSPREAMELGIATIHQELAFFGHLTVAENFLMDQPWPRRVWGGVSWASLYQEAARRMNEFNVRLAPDKLFRELSSAQRQEVTIARALSRQAKLLILDEPTASLSAVDAEQLLSQLTCLRHTGTAMIYVSHRLSEVMAVTDRVAVLRDGGLVGCYPTSQATVGALVREMVGRPLDQVYPHTRSGRLGPVLLALEGVSRQGLFHDVTFEIRAGEIVGLAGLVGSGRSELARALFGLYPIDAGRMQWLGEPWRPSSPAAALADGLAYIPEERKRQGFVLDHSVADSISIGFSDLLAHWGLVPEARARRCVTKILHELGVRTHSVDQPIGSLSGGNQQKSLLGRCLERQPTLVIFDEPTRGVDVGAKAEIHGLIDNLAHAGRGVLLISSDLPEVLGLSDRVFVMHRGALATELTGSSKTQENVILAASGLVQSKSAGGLA